MIQLSPLRTLGLACLLLLSTACGSNDSSETVSAGASGELPSAGAPPTAGSPSGGAPGAGAGGSGGSGGTGIAGGSPAGAPSGGAPSAGASSAGAAGLAEYPPLPAQLTLHVAGDSTAAIFPETDPTHRVGWAAVAKQFFDATVSIDDAAQSGRSSKSFIDEGFWTALKARIKPGDYVLIGFGHNDEKVDDPARYTDPATTYRSYLKTYISEARSAGGVAVLLTPISRRKYASGKITASHGAYPAAVLAVASETGTPVIDLTERTRVWLEALGPIDSIPYFAPDDTTHLSALGAPAVAQLVCQGARDLPLPLALRLLPVN